VHDAARLPSPETQPEGEAGSPDGVLHIVYPSLIADPRRVGTLNGPDPPEHGFVTDVHFRFTRRLAFLLAVTAVTAFVGAGASPATAASKSCAKQVVADWYGDGRVDSIYPLHCYQDAIRSLPIDVLDYSNAKEDILRALAFARRGRSDPGPAGGPRPTEEPADPTDTTGTTGTDGSAGPAEPSDPGEPGGAPEETVASPPVDTSGPSSVPIPLLVLGGLALLLLAAGGAGYLSRRAQARREGGPPGAA
jgi:hypothetical protein